MNETYKFLITPSHGYLIVSLADLWAAIRKGAKFSNYSSVVDDKVYLEEDRDANIFIKALGIEEEDITEIWGEFHHEQYPCISDTIKEWHIGK